jgi:hypothetical protein
LDASANRAPCSFVLAGGFRPQTLDQRFGRVIGHQIGYEGLEPRSPTPSIRRDGKTVLGHLGIPEEMETHVDENLEGVFRVDRRHVVSPPTAATPRHRS